MKGQITIASQALPEVDSMFPNRTWHKSNNYSYRTTKIRRSIDRNGLRFGMRHLSGCLVQLEPHEKHQTGRRLDGNLLNGRQRDEQ